MERGVHDLMRPRRRFERANLAALLQHYGLRTSWLDVVDDLRTAIWFATHTIGGGVVTERSCGSGWIHILCGKSSSEALDVIDLRVAHQELSLRPHTQQGFSIRGKHADLNGFVAASVEFPISERWRLNGYLAEAAFLFQPPALDHTLRLLKRKSIDDLLLNTEAHFSLPARTLGRIVAIE